MRLSNVCACSFSLQQAVEKSRLFNSREGLFGKDLTEYDILGQINRAFEPFCTLWETASNWCVLLSVAFAAVVSRWFFVFVGLGSNANHCVHSPALTLCLSGSGSISEAGHSKYVVRLRSSVDLVRSCWGVVCIFE